ncbi:MAG TPA: excinuclease ABC subunit A [Nitrospinae bacterium]|jgi:proteic killer suppression protein|nr:excinuclease ABC subunit A [Nitrospinota bacterium]
MIKSFRCKDTDRLFQDSPVSRFRSIERAARRKLEILEAAIDLNDLRQPSGNRLEAIKGSLKGQFSIRISDQWRVCFRWKEDHAQEVEIVDYH